MNINEFNSNPRILLVVNKADLKELFKEWHGENKETVKEKEEYLTPDEVSLRYKVSKVTLWRNSKNGLWPKPIKVGRKSLYRKSDMDDIFKANNK